MNKIEYLKALKEALRDIDESVMEEIVSDYEEHFQVGIEKGKSEEEICEDLGSIDDLVEEIKGVYNTDSKEDKKESDDQADSKNKKFKDWHFNINNIDSEKIGDAINSALDSAGEAISKIDVIEISHTLKSTLGQATSSINNFADNYLKNQGTGPFDFNKRNAEGYKENVSKSYDDSEEPMNSGDASKSSVSYDAEPTVETSDCAQADTENKAGKAETTGSEEGRMESCAESSEEAHKECCEESREKPVTGGDESEAENIKNAGKGLNLIIDGICADVNIQKSSNDKINISYENNGNERQKQMYEFYSYKEGNTVYAGIRRVGKAVFLFNLKLYSININVEIPENMSNVNIKTASGDIKITNVNSDRIVAATASGEVLINRIYTTDFRIKCSSGDIKLDDVNSIQLNASTESGDVKANNIEAKFLSLKSTSGDVAARNLKADIIDNSSLSGNLDINNMKASECKIRSTSGDIDINEFTMNNADVSSVSGGIKLSKIIGDGLRVGSISGNVTLEVNVKRCHASSKSGNVNVKCDGDIVLESSSTSGNVNVNLKNYGNGYGIKSRTTSGELYINYNNVCQRNLKTGTYTYGNQGSELILSSVSGDIHLND